MVYTATSWPGEGSTMNVVLFSSEGWATSHWSIVNLEYLSSTTTIEPPFSSPVEGEGVIDGNYLHIVLPTYYRWTEMSANNGDFNKLFTFTELDAAVDSMALVYSDLTPLVNSEEFVGCFYLINTTMEVTADAPGYTASIVLDGEVLGYAFGRWYNDWYVYGESYPYGLIAFTRMIWTAPRPAAGELEFWVRVNGVIVKRTVDWDGEKFTGPLPEQYASMATYIGSMSSLGRYESWNQIQ